MRLIDAELFKTCLETYRKVHMNYLRFKHDKRVAEEVIDDIGLVLNIADTVDAVPVVRCENCKWYKPIVGSDLMFCTYVIGAEFVRQPDDFCSRGEQK